MLGFAGLPIGVRKQSLTSRCGTEAGSESEVAEGVKSTVEGGRERFRQRRQGPPRQTAVIGAAVHKEEPGEQWEVEIEVGEWSLGKTRQGDGGEDRTVDENEISPVGTPEESTGTSPNTPPTVSIGARPVRGGSTGGPTGSSVVISVAGLPVVMSIMSPAARPAAMSIVSPLIAGNRDSPPPSSVSASAAMIPKTTKAAKARPPANPMMDCGSSEWRAIREG